MTLSFVRLTFLMENTASAPGLATEHGLSILVETNNGNILFDTGASEAFLENAATLGCDLANVEAVVLSHGHYDHGGGLRAAMQTLPKATLIAHPHALLAKWAKEPNGSCKEIGVPDRETFLAEFDARIERTAEPMPLFPGASTTGEIPLVTDYEPMNPRFVEANSPTAKIDSFRDEQVLILDSENGLIVLIGCAHVGVGNILARANELFPTRPFHAVIGGFHLRRAPEERIDRTAQAFLEYDVDTVVPLHCTGADAAARLAGHLGERCGTAACGSVLEFETTPL